MLTENKKLGEKQNRKREFEEKTEKLERGRRKKVKKISVCVGHNYKVAIQ